MKYSSAILSALFFSLAVLPVSLQASSVDNINAKVLVSQANQVQLQSKIDHLDKQQSALDTEYRQLLQTLEATNVYNQQLIQRLHKLDTSIDNISEQLVSVVAIDSEITPLMSQMYQSLLGFVQADIPFLQRQRLTQMQVLEADLADPELSVSAKYQKLLQAFVEEESYAAQMKSYQGNLNISGRDTQVNFLHLGRSAWYYQTLDARSVAIWQQATKRWQLLDANGNENISKAINMASNVGIPELINFNLRGLSQ
ncbi:MAG: DUF3450 domain-containing protein [Oceanospirillaceae bacterium]|nr:DUF3450 domain-containing protein [Oceanospirillaceae bacterium]